MDRAMVVLEQKGKTITSLLKKAEDEYERSVAEVIKRAFMEMVVPFCQKHNLEFFSGCGCGYFTDPVSGVHYGDGYVDFYKVKVPDEDVDGIDAYDAFVEKHHSFYNSEEFVVLRKTLESGTLSGNSYGIGTMMKSYKPGDLL